MFTRILSLSSLVRSKEVELTGEAIKSEELRQNLTDQSALSIPLVTQNIGFPTYSHTNVVACIFLIRACLLVKRAPKYWFFTPQSNQIDPPTKKQCYIR